MVKIENTYVSLEIFTKEFLCDLSKCHGDCCVYGAAGAPITKVEEKELEEQYEVYKPYMKPEGVKAIEEQGFGVLDYDGDLTTPLINGEECAYSIYENGVTWCAIEKAWLDKKLEFRKPISCHLYPIRVTRHSRDQLFLNYNKWDICRAAEVLGKKNGVPLFKVLKEPLIRKFGEQYYEQLELVYRELKANKMI